jgi:hypothetical protein
MIRFSSLAFLVFAINTASAEVVSLVCALKDSPGKDLPIVFDTESRKILNLPVDAQKIDDHSIYFKLTSKGVTFESTISRSTGLMSATFRNPDGYTDVINYSCSRRTANKF